MDRPTTDFVRVRELFEAALDLPEDARASFLARSTEDPTIARRVEELLLHDEAATGFLSGPAARLATGPELDAEAWIGRRLGGFEVRSLLARGGMGLVFEAEQRSPRRLVALKTLRRRYGSDEAVRRFRLEVEVLGLLKHPAIAQIHGAGTFEDRGEQIPYIAMELVEGARPLPRFAEETGAAEARRLRLFQTVCEAVEHGHRKGIVHRDLKPANVLVDRHGAVKVIDFGLARVADPDAVGVSVVETLQGGLLGTLEYMSPEHISGNPLDVDVRSDVFSLGCILLELLGDRPPRDFSGLTIPAAVRRLANEEPTIPPGLPGELRWILVRALERSPDRRYASARALSDDLDRYLAGDSVHAVQPTVLYQLSKFGRRHRALIGALSAVLLALGLGLFEARREAARARAAELDAREQGRAAQQQAAVAQSVGQFLSGLFKSANAYRDGADARVVDLIDEGLAELPGVSDPTAHAILASLVAEGLLHTGQTERSYTLLEPAWRQIESEFPAGDADRLHAGAVWADLLEQRGEYDRSLAATDALLIEARAALADGHADRRYLDLNRASLLGRFGRYDEQEQVLRDLLGTLGPPTDDVATRVDLLHKLGGCLTAQGRPSEAIEVLGDAAARAAADEAVPELYRSVIEMALGSAHSKANQLETAEQHLRRALEGFDRAGGTPSNRFGVRINLVGVACSRASVGAEVDLEELRIAMDDAEALLPQLEVEPGRFRLSWLSARSPLDRRLGDPEAAVAHSREMVDLANAQYPEQNPYAPTGYSGLAFALADAGRLRDAIDLYAESEPAVARSFGHGSSAWRLLTRNHFILLYNNGEHEAARDVAEDLVAATPADADDLARNRKLLALATEAAD